MVIRQTYDQPIVELAIIEVDTSLLAVSDVNIVDWGDGGEIIEE